MIATFFYALTGGTLVVLATGRPDQIAWRFLRLVGCLVLALATLVTVWLAAYGHTAGRPEAAWAVRSGMVAAAAATLIILVAPAAPVMPRSFRAVCALGGAAALVSAVLLAPEAAPPRAPAHIVALSIAALVLGALLLGSITVAWLLGHAYLTATRMTIAPLRHFTRLLGWAVAARSGALAVSLLALWLAPCPNGPVLAQLFDGWTDLMVLFLRTVVGLIAVGVFAYMVQACVQLRATQSATGILYFGSVFAYVGELSAHYLSGEYNWPL